MVHTQKCIIMSSIRLVFPLISSLAQHGDDGMTGWPGASELLNITVGTQSISPLYWAIESGSLNTAKAMLEEPPGVETCDSRRLRGVRGAECSVAKTQRHCYIHDVLQKLYALGLGSLETELTDVGSVFFLERNHRLHCKLNMELQL